MRPLYTRLVSEREHAFAELEESRIRGENEVGGRTLAQTIELISKLCRYCIVFADGDKSNLKMLMEDLAARILTPAMRVLLCLSLVPCPDFAKLLNETAVKTVVDEYVIFPNTKTKSFYLALT